MKKRFSYLVLFLTAGLYIDVRFVPRYENSLDVCNGDYNQRTFMIQTIVPFRPERENFYFGIGNKHYQESHSISKPYCDSKTKTYGRAYEQQSGCAGIERNFGGHTHFLDLVFFLDPVMDEPTYQVDYKETNKQYYEAAKSYWNSVMDTPCGEAK